MNIRVLPCGPWVLQLIVGLELPIMHILRGFDLPRPQPLGNRIMYYVLCLHDVLRCGVSAQGTMGCAGEIAERLGTDQVYTDRQLACVSVLTFDVTSAVYASASGKCLASVWQVS